MIFDRLADRVEAESRVIVTKVAMFTLGIQSTWKATYKITAKPPSRTIEITMTQWRKHLPLSHYSGASMQI